MLISRSAGVSRTAPSVTRPTAPSWIARIAKMSPIVPASVSLRASITSTSPGCSDSIAARCVLSRGAYVSTRSSRTGTNRNVRARPTIRCPGLIGDNPDMNVVRTPRLCNIAVSVAVATDASLRLVSASISVARSSLIWPMIPSCGTIDRVAHPGSDRSNRCRSATEGTGLGSILGNRVTRVEDPRFLTGAGRYVDSIHLPNEAWCAYVRSPYAPATIESIDVSEAVSAPGVLRVFTAGDLTGLNPTPPTRPNLPPAMTRPFLASDRVRFVGEPVVAVVAESQAAALDAAELVLVEYEPLPVVTDVAESVSGEVLIFPDAGTNTVLKLETPRQADF